MPRHVHLLLLCCIGFAKCEGTIDNDHLDLLQRAAKQDEVEDIVDDDNADADDLNDADADVDDLNDGDDDLDDLDEDESTGVSVCASGEGQTCQCTGTVYYGRKYVNGRPGGGATTSLSQLKGSGFKSRSVSGQVSCSNGGMGGDPLYGYYKYCLCEAAKVSGASPFVCAHGEGANCQCDGTVYYGAKFVGGRPGGGQTTSFDQLKARGYRTKSVSGSTSCSSGAMGGDPLYGYYKYCYCLPRETPSPTPSPTARPTPSPTPSPTGKCKSRCDKIHSKWARKGKASFGVKRVCKKKMCAGCSICR